MRSDDAKIRHGQVAKQQWTHGLDKAHVLEDHIVCRTQQRVISIFSRARWCCRERQKTAITNRVEVGLGAVVRKLECRVDNTQGCCEAVVRCLDTTEWIGFEIELVDETQLDCTGCSKSEAVQVEAVLVELLFLV